VSGWSWQDVILYGPGWAACLMLPLGPLVDRWLERRFQRQYRERWGVDYDGP
jgi:hypothetical protein